MIDSNVSFWLIFFFTSLFFPLLSAKSLGLTPREHVSTLCFALALTAATTALANNMGDIAITPATGVVTFTKRWAVSPTLSGFHYMAHDWGSGSNQFYSMTSATIPSGGNTLAYRYYVSLDGTTTPHSDIGSKLTPDSYSALTSSAPDVGFGPNNYYFIHHKGTTDYFTTIVPSSGTASAVTDLKPMSAPGGPSTVTGVSGYFALTFAAANLGYGSNIMYYLRVDVASSSTKFGSFAPGLASVVSDHFDLGTGFAYKAMAFIGDDIGYGVNKMYYLRQDSVTGFTLFGMLNPGDGAVADICSLGGVFTALTYTPTDLSFGINKVYVAGVFGATYQTISFKKITSPVSTTAGSFTVTPTASSGLTITLTVDGSSTGAATITGPVSGVFTVTPTSAGIVTLVAAQAGASTPTAYTANSMRQSFTVTSTPAPPTPPPTPQPATPVPPPATPVPPTPAPPSPAPATLTPATPVPAPATPLPATPPPTPLPPTPVPPPPTPLPPTPAPPPATPVPSTAEPPTPSPTPVPPTPVPSTSVPTTPVPPTPLLTTGVPTQQPPATLAPSTNVPAIVATTTTAQPLAAVTVNPPTAQPTIGSLAPPVATGVPVVATSGQSGLSTLFVLLVSLVSIALRL